ncbi:hypothetical protein GUJ93_ZPchr0014g47398 [Zizania palustris]|uniref:Uncharacterized protein n=1 Tax=Zizania palustris TaxID=103762 RepID=A0A8J5TFX6_ZIZPA|nr:hypothetical protein GUJ93_ZPchr0014g47398 [Zizania palustris]
MPHTWKSKSNESTKPPLITATPGGPRCYPTNRLCSSPPRTNTDRLRKAVLSNPRLCPVPDAPPYPRFSTAVPGTLCGHTIVPSMPPPPHTAMSSVPPPPFHPLRSAADPAPTSPKP